MSWFCVMKINKSLTSNAIMAHVLQQAWNANIAMLLNCQKRMLKNIKYIMLKHYKQEHLSSSHILSTTSKSVQIMIECNSTISTKPHSKSESHESSIIVSSSTCEDITANTYQYHVFDHFESPPNQMIFFSICYILFLVVCVA